ncbi:hypothetical protein B6U98_01005 [Thermoplasmatales archaeon ex4572_165]|nr:MAG: hypothetical protein B6U98_01005 [Thermoplasmatales archaeon ex4572_165]RLF58569.1 MAG: hypothetical protein DRN27_05085 [Thermoplasmata archaeon]
MNPKKITAIGITALFLGLMVIPVQGAIIKEDVDIFPIELSFFKADGSIGSKIISLSSEEITELSTIIEQFSYKNDHNGLMNALRSFFKRCGKGEGMDLFDKGIINVLPGCPIISIGEGRQLSRYHGRVQFKKIVSTWSYPDNGFSMIFGNNLSPKQVLFQRQMGIMIGFVGIYVFIPKVLESQQAGITCFAGSALFAWGTSF